MYCEQCGSLIPDGHSFCSNCGAPAPAQAVPAAQPAAAVAPAPVAAPVVAAAPVAPAPVAPAQPVYQQPAQPVQPVYQQPMTQPVAQPVYQQPMYQPAQPVYQQPVYQQPVVQTPAYQQPSATSGKRPNGAATAGLVFGILTFVFCWLPLYLYGVFALLGLIFSIIGIAKRNAGGKGKAIAGLVLTVLGSCGGIAIQELLWTQVGKQIDKQWEEAVSELYDTNYSAGDTGADDFYIDGDFVNTDNGYVSGVLHIDGYRVDF